MQEREILTREEKQKLNAYCADEIHQFGKKYMQLEQIFNVYGYHIPVECWHNFRDSWFHYRKMYTKKERVSVLNEKYAMEEHLLRAWKDAIIFFLQEISASLEYWYHNSADSENFIYSMDNESEKIVNAVHAMMAQQSDDKKVLNWVKTIIDDYQDVDESVRFRCCYFYFEKYISSENLCKTLQGILHSLKDLILQIRYSSANIARPNEPYEYMQRLQNLLKEINDKLENDGMLYLIPVNAVVSHSLKKLSEDNNTLSKGVS